MRRRHSLTGRLILLFIVTAALIAATMRIGFNYGIQEELRSLAEPHLLEYVTHLEQEIGNPPRQDSALALARRLSMEIHIIAAEGVWSSSGTPPNLAGYRFHPHRLSDGRRVEVGRGEPGPLIRLILENNQILLIPKELKWGAHIPLAFGVTILVVIGLIAAAYHLVRRLFRPIETIREGVNRFANGDLDHRIQVDRRDELGELAASTNAMAREIQQMLEAKRQLLLAISHELRSPLTRARVNAELLQESEQQQRIISDLGSMEHQLAELLESERLDNRHAVLERSAVAPAALIREVLEQHFPAARFTISQEGDEAYLSLDPARIRLLIRNLLENTLRYNPPETEPPGLSSRLDASGWRFTVTDHGSGIPAEHLPHLTEPFYRVDKSRQRDTGGYGLGLYLCRVIAEAHGGRLEIESEPNRGTRVTVFMPLQQQPEETSAAGQ
jgi:signal transduction histidine kinase